MDKKSLVWACMLVFLTFIAVSRAESMQLKMQSEPVTKKNPVGCDEFIIPKNYKQVVLNITMVPNSKVIFSNLSKKSQVCPDGVAVSQDINLGDICQDDISCTMFEKIDFPFRYKAEQCAEMLYVLMVYPAENEDPQSEMSIWAEYINNVPCFTVAGGIHEVVNSETQCGQRTEDMCESNIRCALTTCKYDNNSTENVCLPRVTSLSAREEYCQKSGLTLAEYGALPLDTYSTLTLIIICVVIFLCSCFCLGCYYNLRIYQNKKAPFKVPGFCPECCFPQPKDNYNYSFDGDGIDSQGSFDVLDQNQGRDGTRRGTTKYRAPQFYFEDE